LYLNTEVLTYIVAQYRHIDGKYNINLLELYKRVEKRAIDELY